ncbi:MAG: hypothetical protein M1831_003079 [Alyxoria varia]|nr:MAG: hypothetical protein M1831_003079 [Alyxoria varia]
MALGFAKLSLFLLYLQLFWPLRWLRICVYVGAPLTAAFYGSTTIVQFYFMTPAHGQTQFERLLSPEQGKAVSLYLPISAVGLCIDIFLLALPIKSVLQLQLRGRKKIGLLLIFMTGILIIELYAGITVICMPSIPKVVQHHSAGARGIFDKVALNRQMKSLRLKPEGDIASQLQGHDFSEESQCHDRGQVNNTRVQMSWYREVQSGERVDLSKSHAISNGDDSSSYARTSGTE